MMDIFEIVLKKNILFKEHSIFYLLVAFNFVCRFQVVILSAINVQILNYRQFFICTNDLF